MAVFNFMKSVYQQSWCTLRFIELYEVKEQQSACQQMTRKHGPALGVHDDRRPGV